MTTSTAPAPGEGGETAVWHPTLPIQINWTYAVRGCKADVFCPGNAYPWRMARIEAPSPEAAEAYARLLTAAPDLLEALQAIVSLLGCPAGVDRAAVEPTYDAARAAIAKALSPDLSGGEG